MSLVVRASGSCKAEAPVLFLGIVGPVLQVTGGVSCSWNTVACLGAAGQREALPHWNLGHTSFSFAPLGSFSRTSSRLELERCLQQQSLEGVEQSGVSGRGLRAAVCPESRELGTLGRESFRSAHFLLAPARVWASLGAITSACSHRAGGTAFLVDLVVPPSPSISESDDAPHLPRKPLGRMTCFPVCPKLGTSRIMGA